VNQKHILNINVNISEVNIVNIKCSRQERKSHLLTDYRKIAVLLPIAIRLVNHPQLCSFAEYHFSIAELADL